MNSIIRDYMRPLTETEEPAMFSLGVLLTLLLINSRSLISAETVITCDGAVMQLSCETGVIRVQSATFGRNSNQICNAGRPADQVSNTKCSMDIPAFSKRCDGLEKCEIFTQGLSQGQDPCYGTYKYYTVNFICIPAETSLTCSGGYGYLKCAFGRIQINTANFGRVDKQACSEGRPASEVQNTNCFAANSLVVVSQSCNGQTACQLDATNLAFGDPCYGTNKYLSVSYFCIPPEIRSSLACQDVNNNLSCEGGRVIHIQSAIYGRTDSITCSTGRSASELAKIDCYGANSQTVVANGCEGKPSCSISASNGVFSDPCPGTFKYLYISYSCV